MNTNNDESRYVCFFQSVLTIGVMSRGKTQQEAEQKAQLMMHDKSGLNYCAFDQSPFEMTEVQKWEPEFETDLSSDKLSFLFDPDDSTKNVIATRLGKKAEELTDTDLEMFVKDSIDMALTAEETKHLDDKK